MKRCPWTGRDALRTAEVDGARWLAHARLWRPGGDDALTTDAGVETAVILLSGTFDLVGNGTAWPARGARKTPFQGRPMAVFLPPGAELRAENGPADGSGELLLVGARQPELPPPAQGREGLSRKPLLPLAGSGKSYDPASGEWRPAETFPTAAESLPSRRFERLPVGDTFVDRVFAPGYAGGGQVRVPAGAARAPAAVPAPPPGDELLLFVRPAGTARVAAGERSEAVEGDAVLWLAAGEGATAVVHAAASPCYVAIAYAPK